MKEFDYIIIGGGCAGLSLAYELNLHNKLDKKKLAIIEPRNEYVRDKTWSFWKVTFHNFEDCVKKSWNKFNLKVENSIAFGTQVNECQKYPYQTIDSGLFYKKITDNLKKNKNIYFFNKIDELNTKNSTIFNSVPQFENQTSNLWQHFCGYEITTKKDCFNDKTITLMDFCCEQKNNVHFFYVLPFSKRKALIETTWISKNNDNSLKDYDLQIKNYIKNNFFNSEYEISYKEEGAIPLFYPTDSNKNNQINIGTAGCMTRLSTGYTFLNIQEHSKYIRMNIDKIENVKRFELSKKYKILDKIFLNVLREKPEIMPAIFYKIFYRNELKAIKFLSNKSNLIDDLSIILKMPKWIFIKSLFN